MIKAGSQPPTVMGSRTGEATMAARLPGMRFRAWRGSAGVCTSFALTRPSDTHALPSTGSYHSCMPYHAAARPTTPRRAVHARLLLLAGMLCVIGAAHAARPASAQTKPVTLIVDGTQRYQQIDGFGVNINSNQWENGALAPVLDTLIDTVGIKTWRVIVESHENWEPSPTA